MSCPRSSLHFAANEGDKQATETKEIVSRFQRSINATNFGIGTLESDRLKPLRLETRIGLYFVEIEQDSRDRIDSIRSDLALESDRLKPVRLET